MSNISDSCVPLQQYLELELEWRHRITLREAQLLLCRYFPQQPGVVSMEQYRVRQHGVLHVRLGTLTRFAERSFRFDTIDELLGLLGAPFGTSRSNSITTTTPLSIVKTTLCFHKYFHYDSRFSLASNNRLPRIIACKGSLEVPDWFVSNTITSSSSSSVAVEDASTADLDVERLKASLAHHENMEMDRSDNNLGLRFYRKIYTVDESCGGVRVCLYAILDEFNTVRYELGVEKELTNSSDSPMAALLDCSQAIELMRPFLEYVESPLINLTTGWLNESNSTAAPPIRSLCCKVSASRHVSLYERYLNRILGYCSKNHSRFLAKLKINGVRCFAVFDGAHRLHLHNGIELDLRSMLPHHQPQSFREIFCTDFVYQLEQLSTKRYFITDVLAVRNRYAVVIQPPLYGYSSAVQRYKRQPTQDWPYNLIHTELANNQRLIALIANARRSCCLARREHRQQQQRSDDDDDHDDDHDDDEDDDDELTEEESNDSQTIAPAAAAVAAAAAAAAAADDEDEATNKVDGGTGGDGGGIDYGFVSLDVTAARAMLDRLAIDIGTHPNTLLRVNTFRKLDELADQLIAKQFARHQFLATYKNLLRLFAQDTQHYRAILERCCHCMFSADLSTITGDTDEQLQDQTSVEWFDQFLVPQLFEHTDGLLLYKQLARTTRRNQCYFNTLLRRNFDVYKVKVFQTIELMYTENEQQRVRWFKTDDFFRKFYFVRNADDDADDDDVWRRFDMTPVQLRIPSQLLPLRPLHVYEILCESETSFYLVASRPDKSIPDSNYKVNSIVFGRTTLDDMALRN